MTITQPVDLPGTKTLARPKYRLDPLSIQANPLIGWASASVKGSLAVGRKGQLMVVDRVDVFGIGGVTAQAHFVALRCTNQADTAGDDLLFWTGSSASENYNRNWEIKNFGYVSEPSFSQPSPVPGGSNWVEANNWLGYYTFNVGAAQPAEDSFEVMLPGLRYLERNSSFNHGIRPGVWGSKVVSMAATGLGVPGYMTNGTIIAAPGVGKFSTIRTMCINASGGATHYRFGVGYDPIGLVTIAAASSTTVINVTTPTLVAGALIGSMFAVVTGNRRGEVRLITANTTNTITLSAALTLAPAAADTASVITPIHEWYSTAKLNGFSVPDMETNLNIPVPENKEILFYCEATSSGGAGAPTTDFDQQLSVIIGAETQPISNNNFISLAGAPQ